MPSRHRYVSVTCLLAAVAIGCSANSDVPDLAPADGTVTYQGKPLAGATVTFAPDKGPLAQAITDLDGKFTLATGTLRGVTIGPAKASVSAVPPAQSASPETQSMKPPMNAAEATEYKKMVAAQTQDAEQSRSLIPQKYAKTNTSGLAFTIKPGNDNHFAIELKD